MNRRNFLVGTAWAATVSKMQAEPKPLRVGVIAQGKNPDQAVGRVKELGFGNCQIYFEGGGATAAHAWRAALDKAGIEGTSLIVTGPGPEIYDFLQGPATIGLVPRQYRAARIARMKEGSDFAKAAGLPGIQCHCGFFPEYPNDPLFGETVAALREVAGYAKKNGQTFRCETGQETPITLLRAIRAVGLDNVGVNFDCANLVLYGKANPSDAIELLAPLVMGVHAKDGLYPTDPSRLGEEVPIGKGKVDFPHVIQVLRKAGYRGPLTIEREISGPKQTEDILASKKFLEGLVRT